MTIQNTLIEDTARLEALARYDVLDSAPEAAFDDIVAVAQSLCQTPVALISLLDRDRQWFKARVGIDAVETPIEQSVCAHTLGQRTLLVIPDLKEDPRTSSNALVTGPPGIRFYAGTPLVTGDGHVLGALCVIDLQPRPAGLTSDQARGLEALGRHTVMMLELRRVLGDQGKALMQAREASLAFLDQVHASEMAGAVLREGVASAAAAQEAGRVGVYDMDLTTNVVQTSPEMCRLYGLSPQPTYPASVFEGLAVDQEGGVHATREMRREGSATVAADYRIRRASDGAVRWIARRGKFIKAADGRPIRFVGTVTDETERRLVALRQSALLQLGDETRDAESTAEVIGAAARILGETLGATRVGYSEIDMAAGTFRVERDWTADGAKSVAGRRFELDPASASLALLKMGRTVVANSADEVDWLYLEVPLHLRAGTQAQIKVPLMRRGDLVGVLFMHSTTARQWSPEELAFVASLTDRTYAAFSKAQAEQDQRLLNEELSHRLKNNLAMVQAIAKQTLRGAQDRPAVDALNQRLVALGSAHEVLLRKNWNAARIGDVVGSALALHADPSRFEVNGPDLNLNARTALSLSMLLHELATNALKYGALSAEGGTVGIAWGVDPEEEAEPTFELLWLERGGQPVAAPGREGFGSRLIRLGLAGTRDTVLRYQPTGLNAQFRAPLKLVSEI